MLTGETPFGGPDPFLILNAKTRSDPPSLRHLAAEIPAALEDVVMRALERDPMMRYRGARELGWDLEHHEHVDLEGTLRQRTPPPAPARQSRLFRYMLLGLVPLFIFALLLYVASHS
jgi:serine/threonine protein kinase